MNTASNAAGGVGRSARARSVPAPLVRPAPLRQAVYEALVEMIINRSLLPGEHLVENELAAQLGVSKQPVREALQWLQLEGWVDLRPGRGAYVHLPSEHEADQLLAVRTLLEAESARLAAGSATDNDVQQLWELWRNGPEALKNGDSTALVAANVELHSYVMTIAGNSVLAELHELVARRVRWYYAPLAQARGQEAWDEHADLIRAIAAGKGTQAEAIMRTHTERTRSMWHDIRVARLEQ